MGNEYVPERAGALEPIGPLELYDVLGRLIYRGEAAEKPLLPRGLYFERTGRDVKKAWVP